MRQLRTVSLLTALALLIVGPPAAPASARQETRCTFAYYVHLSPGISTRASSGDLATTEGRGPTGIDCRGTVNGHRATGNGMMRVAGRYGVDHLESCASGLMGDGKSETLSAISIPTDAGRQRLTDRITFTYGRPSSRGVISGTFAGDHYTGTFGLWPVEGNCATRPITKAYITGEGVLR